MVEPQAGGASIRVGAIARTAAFVAFVLATIPGWVNVVDRGIDASWVVGLCLAEANGMVHGKDIAFTFGPLGFALNPTSYATADMHALPIRLTIFAAWCGSVGLLLFRVKGRFAPLVFLIAASLNGLPIPGGPSWSLVGMLILAVLNFLVLAECDRRPAWAIPAAVLAGAAVLTKFSTGVSCTSALGAWSLIQLWREPNRRTVARLASLAGAYSGTMAILFVIYGGPLSALPSYLRVSREMADGYSTQMVSTDVGASPLLPAFLLGLAAVGLLVSTWRRWALAPIFGIMLLPMFTLFKGAVVRLDMGHLLLHWPTMFSLFALLLPIASRIPRVRVAVPLGVVALLALTLQFPAMTTDALATSGPSNWISLWRLPTIRAATQAEQDKLHHARALPGSIRSRIGSETVDVYPWEASLIWANKLNWRPRPVFQSYAAYHPHLDEMGAELYRGPNAPKFILYEQASIDQEITSLVDSRTWVEMLRWYDCVDQADQFLLLERRATPRWTGGNRLASTTHRLKERFEIPVADHRLTFVKAEVQMTFWGRLIAFLYRAEPPRIRLEFKDGMKSIHRMVWQNASGGFLISNVPRDLASVRRLFETGEGSECTAIAIRDVSGWCYRRTFQLRAMLSGPIEESTAQIAVSPTGKAVR